jgi:hypothetical protein
MKTPIELAKEAKEILKRVYDHYPIDEVATADPTSQLGQWREGMRLLEEAITAMDFCTCCGVGLMNEDRPPLCDYCAPSFEVYSDGRAYCASHERGDE